MAAVNPITKEILIKIVYYGPGLGGKTTTLAHIHKGAKPEHRGKMVSLATAVDRTLYFDFLPVKLPKIGDHTFRLQLFTVPGQVHYNATRKLVLTGADGVVMVADSQLSRMDANIESLENLRDNLAEQKISLDTIPLSFQYNKRDIEEIASLEELDNKLNPLKRFAIGTCALKGDGVFEGLQAITKIVLRDLKKREILIHNDDEDSKEIDKQIKFKKEKQGILSTVQEFSESSSTRSQSSMASDEMTATYESHFKGMDESDRVEVESLDDEPKELEKTAKVKKGRGDKVVQPIATPIESALSFVSLFEPADHVLPREIEEAIQQGRNKDALGAIWGGIVHHLKVAGDGLQKKSDVEIVKLLGLDGRQYLEIAKLAKSSESTSDLVPETLLKAYLFLLQIVTAI